MGLVMWAFFALIVLLAFNAFLAMSETSVVASRHGRLQQWAESGNKAAEKALQLARQPEKFLASIQIGVTAIGIILGALSEGSLARWLQIWLAEYPHLAANAHTISTTVMIVLVTYLTFLCELVPKRLTLFNPEAAACRISIPMTLLERVIMPLVAIMTATVRWFVNVLHPSPPKRVPVTEAELLLLVEQGAKAGVFEEEEQEMLTAVLRLGNMRASAIMTPRTEMNWIDINDDPQEVLRKLRHGQEFEVLVADESPDNPVGVLNPRDYLSVLAEGNLKDWKNVISKPCYVPDTENALDLLKRFRETHTNSALVINEYGGVDGMVTIRDLVQSVVGTLPQSSEHILPVDEKQGTYIVDGLTTMEEFRETFGLRPLNEIQPQDFDTVAGLVLDELGHIPVIGEFVLWRGLKLTVMQMDGYRIDKLRVAKEEDAGHGGEPLRGAA